ncbi:hypothetical protein, partial [Rhodococcus jostii]|uniref:hypothetical protein n=1 Tax=Rhodococcus jostii TaxID=132919 RepID=UPI00362D83CA
VLSRNSDSLDMDAGENKTSTVFVRRLHDSGLGLIESIPRMAVCVDEFAPTHSWIKVREVVTARGFDWIGALRDGFGFRWRVRG